MAELDLYSLIGADWLPEIGRYPAAVSNLSPDASVIAAYCAMKKYNKKGIFIIDNTYDLSRISSLFYALFGREPLVFSETEFNFDTVDSSSGTGERSRLAALERMQNGDYDVVITTIDSACMPTPAPESLVNNNIKLSVGETADIMQISEFLSQNGYSMFDMVEGEGSFSKRGDILDVFVTGSENPVRIEFFDKEIERISAFDVISQRRIENIQTVKIIGLRSATVNDISAVLDKLYEQTHHNDVAKDIDALKGGLKIASDKYIPLIYPELCTVFDYAPDGIVFACEPVNLKSRCEFIDWQFAQSVENCIRHGGFIAKEGRYYLTFEQLLTKLENNTYFFSRLPSAPDVKLSALAEADVNESVLPSLDSEEAFSDLQAVLSDGCRCVVTVRDFARADTVRSMLVNNNIAISSDSLESGAAYVVKSALDVNILFNHKKLVLLSDVVTKKHNARKRRKYEGEKIKSFDDISPGDLVVHHAHGIGVYNGIKQITLNNVTKDYLVISYDKGDTLYVPCPQLDLISKYIGAEQSRIKLSRLGSPAWERAKSKVREESRELARELIELYAKRLNAKGFAFSSDTEWQRDFEARFGYEETEDQLICTNEIKADMEKPNPMDRLLCGDVGVGKTEVALRAAFKAVSDSKQVAILVPTTILANQHYNTVKERFAGFPVNVEVLSRFRTPKQIKKAIQGLKTGEVDIVIGTHRLLQKDIEFKDLGLLIVDEEQRFGVKHKDKIKEMSIGVDVLTMSATPIPRTLNMAMSGIRDISIIEEAPSDRLPVMTYVLEYNYDIVNQAILREMRRNGCVFYLKNDIDALDKIATRLSISIPHARIMIVHGQMSGVEIEKAWQAVCDHQVDILLCTTIIETGIDVSFANTLIIEDADRMGLAQLHQIRGRVGRSNRRAYAYLTYRKDKTPSEIAAKRLVTIKEFTEFGSGLKIAMRDLEIRGAGSLLGERQHGNMNIVGYETYMDILKNVILTEQGLAPESKTDCTVDISINAFIPENYISSERTRIDMYKRIAAITSKADFDDALEELTDRFTSPPESVVNLMRISLIRNMARGLGITDIKQKGANLVFFFKEISVQRVKELISAYRGYLLYTTGDKPYLTLLSKDETPKIDRLEEFLTKLKSLPE
ncbi:MAG: transcription-repair coupling factor [Clostridia bacterium]|nr:transcription-repair coupling factor [Clostridia bacterium]